MSSEEMAGVGASRYALFRKAATRISSAMRGDFPLEVIALLESVLAERLEKRAQYLYKQRGTKDSTALSRVRDGFKTLGDLLKALAGEPDAELLSLLKDVDRWRKGRNRVLHEMAKFGEGVSSSWEERLAEAREVAQEGIAVLLAYDRAERRVCHVGRNRRYASATCPDALVPLGQKECEYCSGDASSNRVAIGGADPVDA